MLLNAEKCDQENQDQGGAELKEDSLRLVRKLKSQGHDHIILSHASLCSTLMDMSALMPTATKSPDSLACTPLPMAEYSGCFDEELPSSFSVFSRSATAWW